MGSIVDVKFYHDQVTKQDRLFSLGSDRRLIEYDLRSQYVSTVSGKNIFKNFQRS